MSTQTTYASDKNAAVGEMEIFDSLPQKCRDQINHAAFPVTMSFKNIANADLPLGLSVT